MGSKRNNQHRRNRKAEYLLSHALKRLSEIIEDAMAIGPDAILNSMKPLNVEDSKQVDELEKQLDQYLTENYYEDGVLSWTIPEVITLDQTRELSRRYRKAGWRVVVGGEPENRYVLLTRNTLPADSPESQSDVSH